MLQFLKQDKDVFLPRLPITKRHGQKLFTQYMSNSKDNYIIEYPVLIFKVKSSNKKINNHFKLN